MLLIKKIIVSITVLIANCESIIVCFFVTLFYFIIDNRKIFKKFENWALSKVNALRSISLGNRFKHISKDYKRHGRIDKIKRANHFE